MKKILLISIFSFFGWNANAAFYIDPYVSYLSGDAEFGSNDDLDGVLFGSRLGWSTMGLAFGVDYTSGDLSQDNNSADITPAQLGFFVAYEFPVLFRVYGTYYFADEIEVGNNDWEGTGIKLGFGYTGLPFVSINFEVLKSTYDEINGASTSDRDFDAFMVGLSLPLSL